MTDLVQETEVHIKENTAITLTEASNNDPIETEAGLYQKAKINSASIESTKITQPEDEIIPNINSKKSLETLNLSKTEKIKYFLKKHFFNRKDIMLFCFNLNEYISIV